MKKTGGEGLNHTIDCDPTVSLPECSTTRAPIRLGFSPGSTTRCRSTSVVARGHRWDHARHLHGDLDLLGELDEGTAHLVLNDLDRRPSKGVDRRVVDAQHGVLQILVSLHVLDLYALIACFITVDAKRMRLVNVVVAEELCDAYRLLGGVLLVLEHVGPQPFPDQTLREAVCVLALLEQRRTILLKHWHPCAQDRGVLAALLLRTLELVEDRAGRNGGSLGRDQLRVDWAELRRLAHHDYVGASGVMLMPGGPPMSQSVA
jgi:hypothetical protein